MVKYIYIANNNTMDFTPEITLNKQEQYTYQLLRIGLIIIFIVGAFYTAFIILFPTQYFTFNFTNFNSTKNTIINPRAEESPANKGIISANKTLLFDTATLGNYSIAEISFNLNKKFPLPEKGTVKVRKSYQAFLYPHSDQNDKEFKSFASLISYADSVYIASGEIIYPIDSALTFEALGYKWDNVAPVNSDDIANFKKEKLINLFSAHPNGTILFDKDTGDYFIIRDNNRIVTSKEFLSGLSQKIIPIEVSSMDAAVLEGCQLKKSPLNDKKYSCIIPVEKFQDLIGKDYEFQVNFNSDIKIDSINIQFKQDINWLNFRSTLGQIITRIKNNYVGE